MAILFDEIVFGPILSRRYGNSLGINLLPLDNKICNYDCIYCECGWTNLKKQKISFTPYPSIRSAIEDRFAALYHANVAIDHITFAGNGEPTMHPDFANIVDLVHRYRDQYWPKVKTVVLSNGTLLSRPAIHQALQRIDRPTLKLDSANEHYYKLINKPFHTKSLSNYVQQLAEFGNKLVIQAMFLKGNVNGEEIDNSTSKEVETWLNALEIIRPQSVVVYSLDRETPLSGLQKISAERLQEISQSVECLGISCQYY